MRQASDFGRSGESCFLTKVKEPHKKWESRILPFLLQGSYGFSNIFCPCAWRFCDLDRRELFGISIQDADDGELEDEADFGSALQALLGKRSTFSAGTLDDTFLALRRKPRETVAEHTRRLNNFLSDSYVWFSTQLEMSALRRSCLFPRTGLEGE